MWYTFVGNGHQATISTCGYPTDFDTKLFVMRADQFGVSTCDPTHMHCLAYNDDYSGCDLASSVTICTQSNMRYYVVVSGYSSSSEGQFAISIGDNGAHCQDCHCSSGQQCGTDSCGGLCENGGACVSPDICYNERCHTRAANAECALAEIIKTPGSVSGAFRPRWRKKFP